MKLFSKIFSVACLAGTLFTSGSSFAENTPDGMDPLSIHGSVTAVPACKNNHYAMWVYNQGYHSQSCQVSCKHIISRDNFSVYLHPGESVLLEGTHGTGHCNMTCTDQYTGSVGSNYFTIRC